MKEIEKIKEEFIKGTGYERFFTFKQREGLTESDIDSLMERAFNAALELAAEKAEINQKHCYNWTVDKESILNLKITDNQ